MQASAVPAKFPIPFANDAGSGFIQPIPVASQRGITPGRASLTTGFPPENFLPQASGGTPTLGQDWNGLHFQETAWLQWLQAGGPVTYDATFQGEISGYPLGARIQSAVTTGLIWYSTTDNNTTNPDTGGAGWVNPLAALAPIASPTFTGTPRGPTAAPGNNTNQFATTAFIAAAVAPLAPLSSPTFTGTPGGPTAAFGTSTNQFATTAFIAAAVAPLAPLSSPTFTGTPRAPTAAPGNNTLQLSTTQFVTGAIATATAAIIAALSTISSSPQVLGSGGNTWAHGLSAAPSQWGAYLICVTANSGFAPGQQVNLPATTYTAAGGGNASYYNCGADTRNVFTNWNASNLLSLGPSTQYLTPGDWNIVLWARQ